MGRLLGDEDGETDGVAEGEASTDVVFQASCSAHTHDARLHFNPYTT